MAQRFLNDPSALGTGYPVIGANSEVFNLADAVFIDADGFLAIVSTSSKVLGFIVDQGPLTMESDNETVAKVCPKYCYDSNVLVVYPSDQACAQTDVGTYADLGTTTSGGQILNLSGGATGQFFIWGFDPNADGTTTDVVVSIGEPQRFAFAQS